MTSPRLDCLCAGIIVADHVCAPVPELPRAGELVLTKRLDLALGGCASNVAVDLARLNLDVGIVGRVGDDVFGRFVRDVLQDSGVDCAGLSVSPTADTSGTLVINTRGEDRRFIHSLGANAEWTGLEVTASDIQQTQLLYLGGYCLIDSLLPQTVANLFATARQHGVITVLDVVLSGSGDYRDRLAPVLPWTSVFVPNSDEAQVLTGLADPLDQATALHKAGAERVIVTSGGDGLVVVDADRRLQVDAYPVEAIDSTGGGDGFVAGYIRGLLDQLDVETCLRYGAAMGAHCVRQIGATSGAPRADQLREFVATHDLNIRPL
ncbi:MAG: carbohydrate kinase family protein [Planctomycetaceae bacterium]